MFVCHVRECMVTHINIFGTWKLVTPVKCLLKDTSQRMQPSLTKFWRQGTYTTEMRVLSTTFRLQHSMVCNHTTTSFPTRPTTNHLVILIKHPSRGNTAFRQQIFSSLTRLCTSDSSECPAPNSKLADVPSQTKGACFPNIFRFDPWQSACSDLDRSK